MMQVKLNDLEKLPHQDGQSVLIVVDDKFELIVTCNSDGTYWVVLLDVMNIDSKRVQLAHSASEAADIAREWAGQDFTKG
jgi:hypothetical protein